MGLLVHICITKQIRVKPNVQQTIADSDEEEEIAVDPEQLSKIDSLSKVINVMTDVNKLPPVMGMEEMCARMVSSNYY